MKGITCVAMLVLLCTGCASVTRGNTPVAVPEPPVSAPLQSTTASAAQLRRGDTFIYLLTDRTTGRAQAVLLRADRVDGTQVMFNGGARMEKLSGEVMRIESAIAGELDFVTPPGGWMAGGRLPRGNWSMDYVSTVPGSNLRYDLSASADRERVLRTAAGEFRAIRIDLRGWVENAKGHFPMRARYEASAWFAPELRRVIRFEAQARSAGNSGAGFFQVDEIAELIRIDRD